MRVIYDLGANVGSNIPYYLMKCDVVVAVEANADLVKRLENDYSAEIAGGRVHVVHRAVTTQTAAAAAHQARFFVYSGEKPMGHVQSSLVPPEWGGEHFTETTVRLTHVAELFAQYGEPHLVKIDLEHHDLHVVQDLLRRETRPPYLSVEAHDPRILAALLLEEAYVGFKIVRGSTIAIDFADTTIATDAGPVQHAFSKHSAGPFGDDIPGEWLDRPSLVRHFRRFGPGWIDIHAATERPGQHVPLPPEPPPNGLRAPLAVATQMAGLFARHVPRRLFRQD